MVKVVVYLDADEKEKVLEISKKESLSASSFIRNKILKELKNE